MCLYIINKDVVWKPNKSTGKALEKARYLGRNVLQNNFVRLLKWGFNLTRDLPNHMVLFSACDKSLACSPCRCSLLEVAYITQMDCHCGIFHCKRALCCQMRLVTVQRFLLCSLHYGGDSETCLWDLSFRQQIYSQTLLQVLFLIVLFDLCLCRCVQDVVEVSHTLLSNSNGMGTSVHYKWLACTVDSTLPLWYLNCILFLPYNSQHWRHRNKIERRVQFLLSDALSSCVWSCFSIQRRFSWKCCSYLLFANT